MKTTNYQDFLKEINDKIKSSRMGIGKTLANFDTEDLAIVTLNQLDIYLMSALSEDEDDDYNDISCAINLTNLAVPIGMTILGKTEDKSLGLKLNENRFKAGAFLLDCLCNTGVLGLVTTELHSYKDNKVFRVEFTKDKETGKTRPVRKVLHTKRNYTNKKGVVITAIEQAERASKKLNARQPKMLKITNWNVLESLLLAVPLAPKHIVSAHNPQFEEPKDWTGFYHSEGMDLVRRCNRDIIKYFTPENMPIVFTGVNKQQKTGMKVNTDLLDLYNSMEVEDIIKMFGKNYTEKQYESVERSIKRALKVANYIGDKTFYSYIFLDFRGRFYYFMKHLNYSASKFAKSLFLIDEETEVDVDQLKVYIAGLYKYDKVLRKDRVAKFDEHETDFLKWLDNPAGNIGHLKDAEDAHSLLGSIQLYKRCIDTTGDEIVRSGLPIALDDKCSGLQHLTIISRDETTAHLCGLNSGDETADYYEYLKDNTPLFKEHPFWYARLESKFKARKTTKRPGMTFPYSAGAKCMGGQIFEDRRNDPGYEDLTRRLSNEMGEAIYETCVTRMPGIAGTMAEFQRLTQEAYDRGEQWGFTTPSGFIMEQNYYKLETKQIKIRFQGIDIKPRVVMGVTDQIDKDAAIRGAAANGTHAFDAAKLCIQVAKATYPMLVIHDSFATTPGKNTDQLYKDIRTNTVEMYTNYNAIEEVGLDINTGGLDVNNILTSEWFCTY